MIPHSRPTIDSEDTEAVADVIKSGQIAQGLKAQEFEGVVASYIGVKGAVAVSSGTAALHLSLLCLGVKHGDEVIIPSYTCPALLNAVYYTGAIPRLADIDVRSYNIDPNFVEDYLRRKRVKAIIIVHTFGEPVDIDAFLELSKRYSIPIIEDSAQALGATFRGRRIGGFGLISILSFYATKLITTGEGGMLLSGMDDFLEKARDLRDYDKKEVFQLRYNYKMTDIEAALGLSQFKKLPSFLKRREEIAMTYNRALGKSHEKEGRIYYRYILGSPHVERLIGLMEKDGISCRRPVFKPLHHYTGEKGFPQTERAWERSISIPIYPSLTDKEVQRITDSLVRLCPEGFPKGLRR